MATSSSSNGSMGLSVMVKFLDISTGSADRFTASKSQKPSGSKTQPVPVASQESRFLATSISSNNYKIPL